MGAAPLAGVIASFVGKHSVAPAVTNWVSGAAKDVGDWVSGAAKDVGSWLSPKVPALPAPPVLADMTDDAVRRARQAQMMSTNFGRQQTFISGMSLGPLAANPGLLGGGTSLLGGPSQGQTSMLGRGL